MVQFHTMAQGQVLSVLGRAFKITGKEEYKTIGDSVCLYLIDNCSTNLQQFCNSHTDLEQFKSCIIYEEYVAPDNSFVLNGNLFALVGLHDWYETTNCKKYLDAFNKGCKSIELQLPYYDLYGSTSYDLIHLLRDCEINYGTAYSHDYHIALLDALYKYTGNDFFKYYCDLFISYYENEMYYN